jgi:hypothetical protein
MSSCRAGRETEAAGFRPRGSRQETGPGAHCQERSTQRANHFWSQKPGSQAKPTAPEANVVLRQAGRFEGQREPAEIFCALVA